MAQYGIGLATRVVDQVELFGRDERSFATSIVMGQSLGINGKKVVSFVDQTFIYQARELNDSTALLVTCTNSEA